MADELATRETKMPEMIGEKHVLNKLKISCLTQTRMHYKVR
jgi:hypothetical protein